MTYHKSIMAWGDYGPESVTGRWSANTYDADDAVEYVLKSDFEKVRVAADLGLKMAEVNDLWNTAETIKAALTQTTDKEPAQPDPVVGWVCAIEQAVAVADAKRQKYATAAHEKPDPWAQNAAKSLCADDISAAIRALITQRDHDALAAHVAAEVAKARAEDAEMLAESRAYALALQEELRVRTAKLDRECRLTQAQVDRMLVNSTQMHTDLSGCKIALEQAWASNRERAAKITALTEAMTELRAMVVAECPSLLNEDSGGNGELSCQINDLLAGEMTMKTTAGKAADVLLEHIVYYDLVERRGAEIANAVIAELVEIGVKSVQIRAKP